MSSQSNFNERMDRTNWLSRLSAKFAGNPLRHYVPLRQQLPTELDGYEGKYSNQDDFLYFKNMMKMEAYAERKTPAQ